MARAAAAAAEEAAMNSPPPAEAPAPTPPSNSHKAKRPKTDVSPVDAGRPITRGRCRFNGVSLNGDGTYHAFILALGSVMHLGDFKDEEAAAR